MNRQHSSHTNNRRCGDIRLRAALLLVTALVISSCSHFGGGHGGDGHHNASQQVITTQLAITHAAIQAQLVPSAIIAGVSPKQQKVSLLAYSEYGRDCKVSATNVYTTDTDKPRLCYDCSDCQADTVEGAVLEAFTPSVLSKYDPPLLQPRQFGPLVGIRDVGADTLSRKGRYVRSSSNESTADGALVCFGPVERCGASAHRQLAAVTEMASPVTADILSDAWSAALNGPQLAFHGLPHFSSFSWQSGGGGGLDPLVSVIARAAGQPISSFPTTVKLSSGIGASYFYSISPKGIGESVFRGYLRSASGQQPLWEIRLQYGKQVNTRGYQVRVYSASNLRWQSSADSRTSKSLTNEEVAALIEKHLQVTVDRKTGEVSAELKPLRGDYIPLHYALSLQADSELVEEVNSVVVEEDAETGHCNSPGH